MAINNFDALTRLHVSRTLWGIQQVGNVISLAVHHGPVHGMHVQTASRMESPIRDRNNSTICSDIY